MSSVRFASRGELAGFEWDNQRKDWKRPPVDRQVLKDLSARSTLNGLARVAYFLVLLAIPLVATLYVEPDQPVAGHPGSVCLLLRVRLLGGHRSRAPTQDRVRPGRRWVQRGLLLLRPDDHVEQPDLCASLPQAPPPLHDGSERRSGDGLAGGDHHPVAAMVPGQAHPEDPGSRRDSGMVPSGVDPDLTGGGYQGQDDAGAVHGTGDRRHPAGVRWGSS